MVSRLAMQGRLTEPQVPGPCSGSQHDPPAAAAAMPGRLDLGEGHLVDVDRQVTGGRDGHELWYRVDDLNGGYGARAAAEDLQPGAAQHVGGQGDGGAGHHSDLHQANPWRGMGHAAPGDGRDCRLGGLAPQVVDDDVYSVLASRLGEGGPVVGAAERDGG